MIVYGRNPVREALRGPRPVRRVWATKNALRESWLRDPGVQLITTSASEIELKAHAEVHQGVCAEVEAFRYADAGRLIDCALEHGNSGGKPADALILALDQVQDPHNLGAICRTAECAAVTAVVIPERRAAEVTPAVCKASAGAVEHLRVARVRNLADFLRDAKAAGMWVYGAQPDAAATYDTVDYGGPVVLVLGSEGRGLRPRVAASCDQLIAIPVLGAIESLSVSGAAAVLLYAVLASRGPRTA